MRSKERPPAGSRLCVIIDMDIKSPSIDSILKIPTTSGLVQYLQGKAKATEIAYRTKDLNAWIIPAGKDGKSLDLASMLCKPDFTKLKHWLIEDCKFDYVILDAPAFNATSDSKIVAGYTDGMIIVAEQNKSSVKEVKKMQEHLKNIGIVVIGAVLSKSKNKKKRYY